MLRTVQALPPCRAFDTGLRPDPFPDRAASLLPGLLAATRTGLPPASDDELTTTDQPPTRSTSCLLGARQTLTGRHSPPGRGRASLSPNTSRSSTTADDCTRPSATERRSKHSPTTELWRPPQRDQPEDLSKILDTAHLPPRSDLLLVAFDRAPGRDLHAP